MKKIYFLLMLLCIGKTISAQTYFPLLDSINHWQVHPNLIPVRIQNPSTTSGPCTYPYYYYNLLEEYTTQDTVINTNTYKVLDAVADLNPTVCNYGFIREDTATKKIFFLDNVGNPEVLLYDFSMQIGDTIPLTFITGNYFLSGTYTLDSIRTTHILTGFRRIFYLNNHAAFGNPTLPWIESVGCPYHPIYTYSTNNWSGNVFPNCTIFDHSAYEFLSCFDHLTKVYYDSCAYHTALTDACFMTQDTCNYQDICGSVKEYNTDVFITIFPNPSNGNCTVQFQAPQNGEYEINVMDITGKIILLKNEIGFRSSGANTVMLNFSSLKEGIYLIECRSTNSSSYGKLIIQ